MSCVAFPSSLFGLLRSSVVLKVAQTFSPAQLQQMPFYGGKVKHQLPSLFFLTPAMKDPRAAIYLDAGPFCNIHNYKNGKQMCTAVWQASACGLLGKMILKIRSLAL